MIKEYNSDSTIPDLERFEREEEKRKERERFEWKKILDEKKQKRVKEREERELLIRKELEEYNRRKNEKKKMSPINTDNLKVCNDIYYFYDYFPENKNLDWSYDIYKAKNNYSFLKEKYFKAYLDILKTDIECIIVVIPSSKKGYSENSIKHLVKDLIQINHNIIDGTNILERKYDVIPNHSRENKRRTIQEEEDSIQVNHLELIKDKTVLLLDDITTTGNSFKVNKKLLKDYGAKYVYCLALAKTV